jgi:type I restriction enzyme S subunit
MREWRRDSIRQLVGAPISGKRPVGGVNAEAEGIPSLGGENIRADGGMDYETINRIPAKFFQSMPKGRLQENDVLINKDGAQTGKVGIYDGRFAEAAVNEHVFILRSSNGTIDQRLLYYYLLLAETQSKIARRITGSAQPGLNSQFVDAVHLAFPTDRDEQHWIAEVLATVDETIEQTEALIAKTKKIKAGLMHDLFTRGVTADGQLRPPREDAPQLYKESPLGWIPKEWELVGLVHYLDDSAGIKPGPFGSSLKKESYSQAGYRVYGQEQVIAGSLTVGNYYVDEHKYSELRAFAVADGDVLMSLVGTIGHVIVVRPPFEPGIINPRLVRFRPDRNKVHPEFLKFLLMTSGARHQMEALAGGGTMPVINGKVARRLRVPLIKRDEQMLIFGTIQAIDLCLGITSESLSKLTQLKAGLMDDLLNGRVIVSVESAPGFMANV